MRDPPIRCGECYTLPVHLTYRERLLRRGWRCVRPDAGATSTQCRLQRLLYGRLADGCRVVFVILGMGIEGVRSLNSRANRERGIRMVGIGPIMRVKHVWSRSMRGIMRVVVRMGVSVRVGLRIRVDWRQMGCGWTCRRGGAGVRGLLGSC